MKNDLLNALKLSNVFSDKFNQVTFSVKPEDKSFLVSAKNNDVGENTTNVSSAIKGDAVEVNCNYKYISDCFQSISSDSVSLDFTEANKPIIIKGVSDNSFLYLVMPMNR